MSALCRDNDPELWFHDSEPQRRNAKAICNRCPARQACMQHALDRKIKHGIWGGLDEDQRHNILNPATPRKRRKLSQPSDKTSEVRGVSWNPRKKRWVVLIRHGGVTHWVGTYDEQIEAEAAAIAKCKEFGTSPRRRCWA